MKLLAPSTALAAALAMAAASATAEDVGSRASAPVIYGTIKGTVALPNPVTTVIEVEGQEGIALVSSNGRFVVRGVIMDMWTQQTLTTLDAVREAANKVNLANIPVEDEDVDPIYVGEGPEMVSVFVDPLCPFCVQLFDDINADPTILDDYTFRIFVVPFLGEQSNRAVTSVSCATDRAEAIEAMFSHDTRWMATSTSGLEECDPQPMLQRTIFAQMIGVTGVPFLIAPDGSTQAGKPADLRKFLGG